MAERLQSGIAGAVLFEGGATPVGLPAVDFHDQSPVSPEEVDLIPIDGHVHLGSGKPVASNQGHEARLEIGTGAIRRIGVADHTINGQPEELGFPDGGGPLGFGDDRAQISKRPRRFGHRDTVAAGAVGAGQGRGTVKRDAAARLSPAPARSL
jgi:hypothetical protein